MNPKTQNPKHRQKKQRGIKKYKVGNVKITDHCYTKSKKVIDMNYNATKRNMQSDEIILAIENDDSWRKLRKEQEWREDTGELCDLASQHERNLWKLGNLKDINLDNLPDTVANNYHFEDF